MTTWKIFYSNSFRPYGPAPAAVSASEYKSIGQVEASDLEDLFRRMNVVDGSEIEMPRKLRCRSMSVGDIAIGPDGTAHYCASAGWTVVEVLS